MNGNTTNFNKISDLTCECERISGLPFKVKTEDFLHYSVSRMDINEREGEFVGRPSGRYVSFFFGRADELDGEAIHDIASAVADELSSLAKRVSAKRSSNLKIAAFGLGNRAVCYDSFGPLACEMTLPGSKLTVFKAGVPSESGLKTSELLRCVVRCFGAELAVAADSLVARSEERVGRVIQLCDSGVNAGSGVGNHADRIDRASLGVPVIAVGIPTALFLDGGLRESGYLAVSPNAEAIARAGAEIISRSLMMAFGEKQPKSE